jgi:two-component system NtrC family sensor kinase
MSSLNFTDLAQSLFEEAGDALFLFDPDSDEILAVNPLALRLSGFSRPELLKMPVTWLYRYEGRSSQQQIQRHAQNSGLFHNQDGFELRTRDSTGWIPVNLTITRLHVQPKTLALITARDVREQRAAHDRVKAIEDELRRVLASVSDCVWSAEIDAGGAWTYRYLSPVIEQITGRSAEFFLAGAKHWWTVVAADDRPACERAVACWRKGQSSQEEYRIVRPDGTCHWVRDSVLVSPMMVGKAAGVRLGGILTDITERKQAEDLLKQTIASERKTHQQLKLAQSQLVQSEKLAALGQLVAGVAHEINNPLAFVSNNTVVLQRDLASLRDLLKLYREADALLKQHAPELHQRIRDFDETVDLQYTLGNLDGLCTRSREGLQRIQLIVKDLRDFARLDESELKETNLNAGIESTLNILRGETKKKGLTLNLELGPIPEVTCYPARINQVVMNLVANAIYACGDGATVTVRTEREGEGEGIVLHVIDNGSGIEPDVLPKIFDPFFTTKPVGQGTGLGLSISHQIIHDHGGRMVVTSKVGEGTHFVVHLPLSARPKGARK